MWYKDNVGGPPRQCTGTNSPTPQPCCRGCRHSKSDRSTVLVQNRAAVVGDAAICIRTLDWLFCFKLQLEELFCAGSVGVCVTWIKAARRTAPRMQRASQPHTHEPSPAMPAPLFFRSAARFTASVHPTLQRLHCLQERCLQEHCLQEHCLITAGLHVSTAVLGRLGRSHSTFPNIQV